MTTETLQMLVLSVAIGLQRDPIIDNVIDYTKINKANEHLHVFTQEARTLLKAYYTDLTVL